MPPSLRIALALPLLAAVPVQAAAPVSGQWLTTEKDSIVEIGPCGAALCGKIARILKPNPKGPSADVNNPDPKLRSRPVLGMAILTGFRDTGKAWEGTIYDPRKGKTYRSTLTLQPNGTLAVKGCISFLCQTMSWTRAR